MKILVKAALFALAGLVSASGSPTEATTITVTTDLDADAADGFCSLREAILAANDDLAHNECPAGSGADRIVFNLALPATVFLTASLPAVTETVAIRGPGADLLAIDGLGAFRPFNLSPIVAGAWYLVEDLSIQHGYSSQGGGVYVGFGGTAVLSRLVVAQNTAGNDGGGVTVESVSGLLAAAEIRDCTLIGNIALGAGGGGGLEVIDGSVVVVSDSAIVDNQALASGGNGAGIILQRGTLTVERSTVSGNAAYDSGGGLFINASGGDASLSLVDSTVYDNVADADLDLDGEGGGLFAATSTNQTLEIDLRNSIVAGNFDNGILLNPDLYFSGALLLTATGFNLIGANDGAAAYFPAGNPNANGDFVGTAASPIDPLLLPLALNNGITLNHRPILDAASPVIDHGACPGRAADQRGHGDVLTHARIVDNPTVPNQAASDACDIGAVERGGLADSAAELFVDGFELGHTLRWDAEVQ